VVVQASTYQTTIGSVPTGTARSTHHSLPISFTLRLETGTRILPSLIGSPTENFSAAPFTYPCHRPLAVRLEAQERKSHTLQYLPVPSRTSQYPPVTPSSIPYLYDSMIDVIDFPFTSAPL
jgi:hypothetical protein